jgi:ankyrin repeat protein
MKSIITIFFLIFMLSGLSSPNRLSRIGISSNLTNDYTTSTVLTSKIKSQNCIQQLINAVKEKNLTLVKRLIIEGCDVNAKIEVGTDIWESPLYYAAGTSDSQMVRLLLEYGADPNLDLGRNMTPFHYSAGASSHETFLLLLDKCKNVNILNVYDNYKTPLIFAIVEGKFENIKSLIEKGAKIDPDSSNAMTSPLSESCFNNHVNIFKFLLMKGANVNARFTIEGEDCLPCLNGITVLHELVDMNTYQDHKMVMEYLNILIKYNPDMNIESDFGLTALEHACFGHDTTLVRWLINHGSRLETDGSSALHCAAMCSNVEMVEFLLKLGANPNSKNENGDTPLLVSYYCCGDGFGDMITDENRIKTARLLIAYGTDPYLKNNKNESFIDLCRGKNRSQICDSIK